MVDISNLTQSINAFKTIVEQNAITPSSLGTLLQSIANAMSASLVSGDLDSLRSSVTTNATALSQLQSALTSMQSTLTTLQSNSAANGSYADAASFATLSSTVSTLQASVNSLLSVTTSLQTEVTKDSNTLASYSLIITNLQKAVSALQSQSSGSSGSSGSSSNVVLTTLQSQMDVLYNKMSLNDTTGTGVKNVLITLSLDIDVGTDEEPESYQLATVTIPAATTTQAGLMSAADKTKLDSCVESDKVWEAINGKTDVNVGSDYIDIELNDNNGEGYGGFSIPVATQSQAGIITANDKAKLDSISMDNGDLVITNGDKVYTFAPVDK